jgi:hypothetical protein
MSPYSDHLFNWPLTTLVRCGNLKEELFHMKDSHGENGKAEM